MNYNTFIINPGSTSTKIAWFEGHNSLVSAVVRHNIEELKAFSTIASQLNYRLEAIKEIIQVQNIDLSVMDAFVGRGGILKPLQGGTYLVEKPMLEDLEATRYGEHACNLGAIIAKRMAQEYNKPAYVVNPVVVDELMDEVRFTGMPEITRRSVFHALNHKAVAIRAAKEIHLKYEESNYIVAHLGGGISVGAHLKGRVVDVHDALVEGPFSPERSGTIPSGPLVEMCFSGKYTKAEIKRKLVGAGGIFAYTGTTDMQKIEGDIATNVQTKKLYDAMIFRIAREICACSASLCGVIDRVIITGGLSHSEYIVEGIKKRVSFLAPILVYPGENEMEALAEGALKVLSGEEKSMEYRRDVDV